MRSSAAWCWGGDTGVIQGRCRGDAGEIQGRYHHAQQRGVVLGGEARGEGRGDDVLDELVGWRRGRLLRGLGLGVGMGLGLALGLGLGLGFGLGLG